jgi:hypothetical protein
VKDWVNTDYETPLESRAGYIGQTWDGEFLPNSAELQALQNFDWDTYRELAYDPTGKNVRLLKVILATTVVTIEFRSATTLRKFWTSCQQSLFIKDAGPWDHPASGSGYVFFLADHATSADLHATMLALRTALDRDLALLQAGGQKG